MSALPDAAGGPAAEGAADPLVAAGVVAAVPTAPAGLRASATSRSKSALIFGVQRVQNLTYEAELTIALGVSDIQDSA